MKKTLKWHEDYVEVILSGEEQFDEQVILYFDGTVERGGICMPPIVLR